MSADDFSDVFSRDERDSGADNAAPASDKARDEAGRFAAKPDTPAPQPEAKAEVAPQPTPPVSEPAEQPSGRMVPLAELLAEREKGKARADKAREETTKQFEERLARFERELQQRPAPQQQQTYQQPEAPDPIVDPRGYADHVRQQAVDSVIVPQLNQSEARARQTHGTDLVNQAYQAAVQSGAARYFTEAAYAGKTADAWGDMVNWFTRQQAIAKIGPDPAAYEKQIREDERKKAREEVIAEMKRGAPPQRFPGSLADATAAGGQGQHLSATAVANDIFDTNRNRRA